MNFEYILNKYSKCYDVYKIMFFLFLNKFKLHIVSPEI